MNFVNEKNRPLLIAIAVLAVGGAVFSCVHFMIGSTAIVVPARVATSSAYTPPPAAVTFGSQYKNSLPRPSGTSDPSPAPGQ